MKTRFTFSAILLLAVVSTAGAQTPTHNASIPPVQVTVTNSNAQAVPVKVTNPTPPPSTVTINNSASQPVPTTDPTNATVSPTLAAFVSTSIKPASDEANVPFSQNTGRRFMVRYLSASCSSQTPGNYVLAVTGPNVLFMPIETKFRGFNFEKAVGGTPVEMMIDSGQEVTFLVSRAPNNAAAAANCSIAMVGYTVPPPPVQQ